MAKPNLVTLYAFIATILIVFGLVAFLGKEQNGGAFLLLAGAFFGLLWVVEFWKAVK